MKTNSMIESFRLARVILYALQADIVLKLSDVSLKGENRTKEIANLYAIRRILAAPGLLP